MFLVTLATPSTKALQVVGLYEVILIKISHNSQMCEVESNFSNFMDQALYCGSQKLGRKQGY